MNSARIINGVVQVPSYYATDPWEPPAPPPVQAEPLRKYEEHASYPSLIELPLCGACGKVAARCSCDPRYTLPLSATTHPDPGAQSTIRIRANQPQKREHCDAIRSAFMALNRTREIPGILELKDDAVLTRLSCDLLDLIPEDHLASIRLNDAMDARGL